MGQVLYIGYSIAIEHHSIYTIATPTQKPMVKVWDSDLQYAWLKGL